MIRRAPEPSIPKSDLEFRESVEAMRRLLKEQRLLRKLKYFPRDFSRRMRRSLKKRLVKKSIKSQGLAGVPSDAPNNENPAPIGKDSVPVEMILHDLRDIEPLATAALSDQRSNLPVVSSLPKKEGVIALTFTNKAAAEMKNW